MPRGGGVIEAASPRLLCRRVALDPECTFAKSFKMVVGTSGAGLHRLRGSSRGCKRSDRNAKSPGSPLMFV